MNLLTASILAAAILLGAILHGGIYVLAPAQIDDEPFAYRLNRWTGHTDICRRDRDERWAVSCAAAWQRNSQY